MMLSINGECIMFRQKPDSYSSKDREKFSKPAHDAYKREQKVANPPGGCMIVLLFPLGTLLLGLLAK